MAFENLNILIINAGSSSIKIAGYVFKYDRAEPEFTGKIEHIGTGNHILRIARKGVEDSIRLQSFDYNSTITELIKWLSVQEWFQKIKAIGHRIVFGANHLNSEVVTDALLNDLSRIIDFDPDHLIYEIEFIKAIKAAFPHLLQVACFDTSFHKTLPPVAKTFAIPNKFTKEGIVRYGFHGISYAFLLEKLKSMDSDAGGGRIIFAHLGNGASLAAVKEGVCIDTSMGFSPSGGIVMSSRCGDIDPGIAWYMMKKGMSPAQFDELINKSSGLLGISGVSGDMRYLLEHEKGNTDVALAIEIFCYQAKKFIGAYIAVLGGIDALVFSGGIGENSPSVRSRICNGLDFAGIRLDEKSNSENLKLISDKEYKAKVFVIPTNEELMIARETLRFYTSG